jgi:hypothetical protein
MRLSKEEHTAIIAQLSYLEPTTPLPDWDALAMELVHMLNEREDMMKRLEDAQTIISVGHYLMPYTNWKDRARAFLARGDDTS